MLPTLDLSPFREADIEGWGGVLSYDRIGGLIVGSGPSESMVKRVHDARSM